MIKNYLKIAYRNLYRNFGYTIISVLGLTVGMAACLLIGLYVADELSYDDFHTSPNRIHVMGVDNSFFGRSMATPYPLASALEASLPAVEHAVRTFGRGEITVHRPDNSMEAKRQLLLVDSTFFQVFDFPACSRSQRRGAQLAGRCCHNRVHGRPTSLATTTR